MHEVMIKKLNTSVVTQYDPNFNTASTKDHNWTRYWASSFQFHFSILKVYFLKPILVVFSSFIQDPIKIFLWIVTRHYQQHQYTKPHKLLYILKTKCCPNSIINFVDKHPNKQHLSHQKPFTPCTLFKGHKNWWLICVSLLDSISTNAKVWMRICEIYASFLKDI